MSSRKSKKRIGSTRRQHQGYKTLEREDNAELQESSSVQHMQPSEMPTYHLDSVPENIEDDQHEARQASSEKLETGAWPEICEAATSASGKKRRIGSTRRAKQGFQAEEKKGEEEEKVESMQIIQKECNIKGKEDLHLKEHSNTQEVVTNEAQTHMPEVVKEQTGDEFLNKQQRLFGGLSLETDRDTCSTESPLPAENPPVRITGKHPNNKDTPQLYGISGNKNLLESEQTSSINISRKVNENSEYNVEVLKKITGSTERPGKGINMLEDIKNSQVGTQEIRNNTLQDPKLTKDHIQLKEITEKLEMAFTVILRGDELEGAGDEDLIPDENTVMDTEAFTCGSGNNNRSSHLIMEEDLHNHHNKKDSKEGTSIHEEGSTMVEMLNPGLVEEQISAHLSYHALEEDMHIVDQTEFTDNAHFIPESTSPDINQLHEHDKSYEEESPESREDQEKQFSTNMEVLEQAEFMLSPPGDLCQDCVETAIKDIGAAETMDSFFYQTGFGTLSKAFGPLEQENMSSSQYDSSVIMVAPLNFHEESTSLKMHPDLKCSKEAEQKTQVNIFSDSMQSEAPPISADVSDFSLSPHNITAENFNLKMYSPDVQHNEEAEQRPQVPILSSTMESEIPITTDISDFYHEEEGSAKHGGSRQKRRMGSTRRTKREHKMEMCGVMSTEANYANEDMNMNTDADLKAEVDILLASKETGIVTNQTNFETDSMASTPKEKYVDNSIPSEMVLSVLQYNLQEDEIKQEKQHQCPENAEQDDNDLKYNEISIQKMETAETITTVGEGIFNKGCICEDGGKFKKHKDEKLEKSLESLGHQNLEDIDTNVSEQAEVENMLLSSREYPSPKCSVTAGDMDTTEKTESFSCQINVETLSCFSSPSCPSPDNIPEIAVIQQNVHAESSDQDELSFKLQHHEEEGKQGASMQKRRMGSTRWTKMWPKMEERCEVMSTKGDYANEGMNTVPDFRADAEVDIIGATKEKEIITSQTDVESLAVASTPIEQGQDIDCSTTAERVSSSFPQCNLQEDEFGLENQHQNPDSIPISILGKETVAVIMEQKSEKTLENNASSTRGPVLATTVEDMDTSKSTSEPHTFYMKSSNLSESDAVSFRLQHHEKKRVNSTLLVEECKEYQTQIQNANEVTVAELDKEDMSSHENIFLPMEATSESIFLQTVDVCSYPKSQPKNCLPHDNQVIVNSDTDATYCPDDSEAAQTESEVELEKCSTAKKPELLVRDLKATKRYKISSTRFHRRQDDNRTESKEIATEEMQTILEHDNKEKSILMRQEREAGEAQREEDLGPSETQRAIQNDTIAEGWDTIKVKIQNTVPEMSVTVSQYQENEERKKEKLLEEEQCIVATTITTAEQTLLVDIAGNNWYNRDTLAVKSTSPSTSTPSENTLMLTPLETSDSLEESKPRKKRMGSRRKTSQCQHKDKTKSHGEADVRNENADSVTKTDKQPVQQLTGGTGASDKTEQGQLDDKLTDVYESECSEPASEAHSYPKGSSVTVVHDQSHLGQIQISESSGTSSNLCADDSPKESRSMHGNQKMSSSCQGQGLENRMKFAANVEGHVDDIYTLRQETRDDTALQSAVEGEQLLCASQLNKCGQQPLSQGEKPDESIDERALSESAQCRTSLLSASSSSSSKQEEDNPSVDPKNSVKKRRMGSTRKTMMIYGKDTNSSLKKDQGPSTERCSDTTTGDMEVLVPNETVMIQETSEIGQPENIQPQDGSTGFGSAGQKEESEGNRRKLGSRRGGQGYRGIGLKGVPEEQSLSQGQDSDSSSLQATQENIHTEGVSEQRRSKQGLHNECEIQKLEPPSGNRGKSDLERNYRQGDTLTSLGEAVMFNIVMVGESSVGKTSFIRRLETGQFLPDPSATLGVDTSIHTLIVDGKLVKLQVWDTAGQERFHSITRQVLHKAQGLILMYDISSCQTFSAVHKWIACIEEGVPSEVVILLLGNKNDNEDRQVLHPEGERLAQEYNIHFMECSAVTGNNVSQAMETLARLLKQTGKENDQKYVTLQKKPQQKRSGCC